MLIAPYVVVGTAVTHMPLWEEASRASAWAVLLATSGYFSLMCSQASLALLSGHVIAAERGDRSAEFLAYLPPSRWQVLLSKAVVLFGATALVWGLNMGASLGADYLVHGTDAARMLTGDMTSLPRLAAIGVLAIGAGWCASSVLENSGPAVAFALVAPIVTFGGFQLTRYLANWPDELSFANVYFTACWPIAIGLFAAGTAYYLHRVEP
jgi:ABC-type transport system involved in multi-copper enzyme maturation permease subunit